MVAHLRRLALGCGAFLLFSVFAHASAETEGEIASDPIAQARSGMLQCYSPDTVSHTCHALAEYRVAPNGDISNPATILIQADPLIVMHSTSKVVIRDHKICGRVLDSDVAAATFDVGGAPASAEATTRLRQRIGPRIIAQGEVCSLFTSDGAGGYFVSVELNGVRHPEMADIIIWVRPTDGFRVAP
ncbi:MAG: hypothetical protein ABUS48_01035 [Pseudomonadota bacterium]